MTKREFEAFGLRLSKAAYAAGFRGPAQLAVATGLNRVTIGAYMRGDRQASLEACVLLAEAVKVSPTWLHSGRNDTKADTKIGISTRANIDTDRTIGVTRYLPNAKTIQRDTTSELGPAQQARQIPLYSSALAGPDGSVSIGVTLMELIEAPAPIAAVPDAYAVRVVGESMEPRYFSSEIVYVHPRMPVKKGDFILAQVTDNGGGDVMGYVKRLVSIDDRKLVVEQLNPKREISFSRDRVKSVHRIVLAG